MPKSQQNLFGAAPAPRSFDQDALGFLISFARKHKGLYWRHAMGNGSLAPGWIGA